MIEGRRILIVDGDPEGRESLSDLLGRSGFACREAETGHEGLEAARDNEPALVLLADVLPGMTSYELCRALRDEFGEALPIFFVSRRRTDALDRVAGLLLGADDYIAQPFVPEELVARIRRAVARAAAVRPEREPRYNLTARELEILDRLAHGLSQNAIAEELVISPKTVATHIQRILAKLGVHSRAEAVARAYRMDLLDRPAPRAERAGVA